jgi:hypothetical protein
MFVDSLLFFVLLMVTTGLPHVLVLASSTHVLHKIEVVHGDSLQGGAPQ